MIDTLKVLFVTSTLEVGGSETKIVRIANALEQSGHSPAIAYLNPPETLLEKIGSGVPVTHLERRGKFSFSSLKRLRSLVSQGFDVIVSVNFYPLLYTVPVAKMFPSIRAKTVCLINTTEFVDNQRLLGYMYSPFLRYCDRLVYGCKAQRDLWRRKYRLPEKGATYIYNGVDSAHFSPEATLTGDYDFRDKFGIPQQAIVIGGIGRFAPEKDFGTLIAAVGALHATGREAYLVLVGEGQEEPLLRAAVEKAGLTRWVIFPGLQKDVRVVLRAFDMFVLPSRAVETFSNAALEAMSMRRPVILSDIGGAAEMIEDGKSGCLFEPGDVDRLAELIIRLVDSQSDRESLGQAARQRVIENFSFDKMLHDYEVLLDSTLRSGDGT